jgi:demethylmenaquinone methyltransferase/2-methoxy-6-polyprenyl-1,4-benzoquinol methylase
MVNGTGMSTRISFREGDVSRLPFDSNTFDWVWSADYVGYATLEPLPLSKELIRVVKPGGTIAIAAWSSEQLLPGYPRLEARLAATSAGIAPFVQGKSPELHFLRALGWFHELGLRKPKAKVFVDNVYAPLNDEVRCALVDVLKMICYFRWGINCFVPGLWRISLLSLRGCRRP